LLYLSFKLHGKRYNFRVRKIFLYKSLPGEGGANDVTILFDENI